MAQLVVFRAIQGLGAGGILPLGMTILGDLYTLEQRGRMQALFSSVWGVASIVGPVAGGYITQALSWRWVFYMNLPFGLVAGLLVGLALVEPPPHGRPRIDYRGAFLLTSAVTLLLLALSQTGGRDRAVGGALLILLYVGTVVLTGLFIRIERHVAEPILPLDLFSDRLVVAVTACGFLVGVSMFGSISFVPLFVQGALERSASQAGSALTPLLLGWVLMSIVTGRVLTRVGYRAMLVGGLSLVAAGFLGLVRVRHDVSILVVYLDLGLMGMGMGMTMLTLLLSLQNAVPRARLGVATSLGQFTRSIGGAVGVALMGAIVAATVPSGRDWLPVEIELALHRAFLAGFVAALAALVAAAQVPRGFPEAQVPAVDPAALRPPASSGSDLRRRWGAPRT